MLWWKCVTTTWTYHFIQQVGRCDLSFKLCLYGWKQYFKFAFFTVQSWGYSTFAYAKPLLIFWILIQRKLLAQYNWNQLSALFWLFLNKRLYYVFQYVYYNKRYHQSKFYEIIWINYLHQVWEELSQNQQVNTWLMMGSRFRWGKVVMQGCITPACCTMNTLCMMWHRSTWNISSK